MAESTPSKPVSTASFKEPLISAMLQGLTDQLLAQKMALANRDLATVESIRQGLEAMVGQLHKMPPTQLKPHAEACYNIHQLVQQNSQLLAQEHQRVSGMLALFQPGTYEASGQQAQPGDHSPGTGVSGMITPGFFGYFNTQRGMLTAQTGINTANQNILNANTPGYTKQRVEQKTMFPHENPSPNSRLASIQQQGQGVFVQAITRVSDGFLDGQIRTENARNDFLSLKKNVLSQVESVLGEPSDTGLQASMQTFFNAAQDVSLNPENLASRTVFVRAAEDLVNVVQSKATQLRDMRTTYVGEPGNASSVANSQITKNVDQANDLLKQLADLNQQIIMVTGSGGHPNDLLDSRDLALKQLNGIMDVNVSITTGEQANITVNTGVGTTAVLVQGNKLRETFKVVANPGPAPTANDVPALVQLNTAGTTLNSQITTGKVGALLDVGGNTAGSVSIQQVLQQVNTLFDTLATQINNVQTTGRDLNGNLATANPLFTLTAGTTLPVFRYSINPSLITDPKLVAAAKDDSTTATGFAGVSDGRNAVAMAQIKQQALSGLGNAQPLEYWNQVAGTTGSTVNQADKQTKFQQAVLDSLENQRSQFSGVNVDEEMVDLLRYQRAFEASAKVFNTYDQIMQRILSLIQG